MTPDDLAQCTYLVVDDDEIAGDVVVSVLQRIGATRIYRADSGDKALSLAGTLRPDFVLLDIYMPETDGWKTLERLRSSVPSAAVLMITGSIRPQDFRQSMDRHVDGYCIKPVLPGILQNALVQAALRRLPSRA